MNVRAERVAASLPAAESGTRYTWRDPARLSDARIAELAAHDLKFAGAPHGNDGHPESRPATLKEKKRKAEARHQRYAALRDSGLTPEQAAAELGIGATTRRAHERRRKQEAEQ